MSTTRDYEETHKPTDADFRESFAWQQDFEESDLLQKATPATERDSGAGIAVLRQTAYYKSTNNEMEAIIDLSIQVDVSLHTVPNQAYWQIAKALRTLAGEMLVRMGEDTGELSDEDCLDFHENLSRRTCLLEWLIYAAGVAVLGGSLFHWIYTGTP